MNNRCKKIPHDQLINLDVIEFIKLIRYLDLPTQINVLFLCKDIYKLFNNLTAQEKKKTILDIPFYLSQQKNLREQRGFNNLKLLGQCQRENILLDAVDVEPFLKNVSQLHGINNGLQIGILIGMIRASNLPALHIIEAFLKDRQTLQISVERELQKRIEENKPDHDNHNHLA